MTVLENLHLGAFLERSRRTFDDRLERTLALFPALKEKLSQTAGSLSGGQQQMVAIGRALMTGPKLLLLDEPSLGLAPLVVREIFSAIERLAADGISILLVEQNINEALTLAHRAWVLENGLITLSGAGPNLLRDPRVRSAYLGVQEEQTT
jgi:branched-chain amino acid transport system ATP-binding protein